MFSCAAHATALGPCLQSHRNRTRTRTTDRGRPCARSLVLGLGLELTAAASACVSFVALSGRCGPCPGTDPPHPRSLYACARAQLRVP